MQLRNRKARFGTVFLLGLITALLFILPWIFKDGFLYLGFDYVEQQIPFNQICNRAVKEGTLLWNSSLDLGTGFLEAYSFYVLGSPFFWLSLIFPADWTYVTVGLMLAFKLAVGAVTAYAWLRTYSKTEDWAMVGGLLYTFSGYQISNLNFNHFADVTALFPLLLLALDQTVKLRKKTPLRNFRLNGRSPFIYQQCLFCGFSRLFSSLFYCYGLVRNIPA